MLPNTWFWPCTCALSDALFIQCFFDSVGLHTPLAWLGRIWSAHSFFFNWHAAASHGEKTGALGGAAQTWTSTLAHCGPVLSTRQITCPLSLNFPIYKMAMLNNMLTWLDCEISEGGSYDSVSYSAGHAAGLLDTWAAHSPFLRATHHHYHRCGM
jgi:hypothetical protein